MCGAVFIYLVSLVLAIIFIYYVYLILKKECLPYKYLFISLQFFQQSDAFS